MHAIGAGDDDNSLFHRNHIYFHVIVPWTDAIITTYSIIYVTSFHHMRRTIVPNKHVYSQSFEQNEGITSDEGYAVPVALNPDYLSADQLSAASHVYDFPVEVW